VAIRKTLSHDTRTREKIQTSQLINRLENHAFGSVELTPTQVKAIEVLLRKTLPDLQAIQHSGDADAPIAHTVKITL
jgi:hypothetical protein